MTVSGSIDSVTIAMVVLVVAASIAGVLTGPLAGPHSPEQSDGRPHRGPPPMTQAAARMPLAEGVSVRGQPNGLTLTHRGGDSLDRRDVTIRVTPGDRSGTRGFGIGSSRSGITRSLWNERSEVAIDAGDTATVRFYLVPGERVGGQSTTALIRSRAACGIRAAGDGRIVLTDRPAGTRNCHIDGTARVPRSVGGVVQPGDEVLVVWSPPESESSQVLYEQEVVDTDR